MGKKKQKGKTEPGEVAASWCIYISSHKELGERKVRLTV